MDDGRVYVDDCVQELKKPYKIGSVLKTHEQAASADDVEDLMTGDHAADAAALKEMMADPLRAPVEPGHARVSWLTGPRDPTVVAAAGLKVIDRPFLLGDAVASAADPGGESGVIWQIRSSAEVQYVNASGLTVQQRVARAGLELISTVCDGDITVHRTMGWVGFIKGAAFTVTVKCAPGQGGHKAHKAADRHRYTFRKLTSMEESPLQCEDEDAGLCQHFPGQRVTIDVQELIKTDLLPDGWSGAMSHKGNTGEYEVVAVELDEAYVDWAVAGPTSPAPSQPPMEWIPVAELLWLQLADAGYRIGDHVRITDPEILSTMPAGASTARITSTSTECRVQWGKTGVVEPGWCASSSLVPRPPTATKDFLPRSFVTRSNDEEEMMDAPLGNPLPASAQPRPPPAADGAGGQPGATGAPPALDASIGPMEDRLGLVTKVDNAQQTCAVRWLTSEDWADPVEDPGEPVEVSVEINRMVLLQSSGFDVSIVDGSLMVTNVAENCPTWNKLLAGDILLSINGVALPQDGCQLSDVAQILMGQDTTTVFLVLERDADQKPTVLDFAEETVSVYDIQMKDDLAFVLGDIVMHGPAFDEAYYGNPQNANGNPQNATTLLESAGLSKEEVAGLTMEEFRDLKAALTASWGLDSAAQDPEPGGATPGANPPATLDDINSNSGHLLPLPGSIYDSSGCVANTQTAAPTASTADSIQWLGQIIEITVDGWLIVRWMDKSFTKTLPIDVILVEPSVEPLPPPDGGYDDNYPSDGSEWTDVSGDEDAMETEYEEFSTPDPPTDVDMQETAPLPPQADPELRASSAMLEDAAPAGEEEEPEVASLDEYAVLELLDSVPPDHQFSGEPNANISASVIHKELKALRKGLPQDGSIFIRSYEARTDLLRAVIFGPENTPYANIPFFFDLMLPNGYPQVPPKMLYHASAARERLNPNLYETGKVCLSLLGTWNGPGWDPKTSSLLQVFMSIQALVLVEEPYFNEPGFEKLKGTAEGTRNSQMYSENAILLGLQSLITLKSRPPTGFGGIMKLYYKEKGARILERFQQTAGDSATGFALTLGKRYLPRLEALFAKK